MSLRHREPKASLSRGQEACPSAPGSPRFARDDGPVKTLARTVLLLSLCLATPALAVSDPAEMLPNPAQEVRAQQVGRQLRCLVCQNESIEDSNADLAKDLRGLVRTRIAAGDTDTQAVDWVVARYGDFVRLRPPVNATTALLWASPLLALAAGAAAILFNRRRPGPPAPLSDAERARLAELS